ncbi:Cytochrome P450 [Nymphaea thermarum]|nr:Cytochrome P450 [Nymphaea thermarum]
MDLIGGKSARWSPSSCYQTGESSCSRTSESMSCGGDQPVDMKWRFSTFIVNIILRMVAGKRYFLDSEEGNTGDAKELWKVISEFFHLLGVLTVTYVIPWLEWLDVGGHLTSRP